MLQFKDEDTEARIGKPAFDFRRPCTACALVQPAVLHRAGTQVEVIFPFPDSLLVSALAALTTSDRKQIFIEDHAQFFNQDHLIA